MFTGYLETLRGSLQAGQIVHPQRMYDPGLVHPYRDQPPCGRQALAETRLVQSVVDRYSGSSSLDELRQEVDSAISGHRTQTRNWALGTAAFALGAAGSALCLPGWMGWAGAGLLGSLGACAGLATYRQSSKAGELQQVAGLLEGWEHNIANPSGLWPIPENDVVPFEYVQYCENLVIGERRRQL